MNKHELEIALKTNLIPILTAITNKSFPDNVEDAENVEFLAYLFISSTLAVLDRSSVLGRPNYYHLGPWAMAKAWSILNTPGRPLMYFIDLLNRCPTL